MSSWIPQFSQPLTKAIRTSEGIMAWAVNVGVVVVTALESSVLPHEVALIVIAANTALHMASRTLLKVFALQKEVGIEAPEMPFEETVDVLPPTPSPELPPETARTPDGPTSG